VNKRLAVVLGSHLSFFENRVLMLKFFFHNCPRINAAASTLTWTSPVNGCWAVGFDPVEFCGLADFLSRVSSFSMLCGLMGTQLGSIEPSDHF
jgi:hypothetical protein